MCHPLIPQPLSDRRTHCRTLATAILCQCQEEVRLVSSSLCVSSKVILIHCQVLAMYSILALGFVPILLIIPPGWPNDQQICVVLDPVLESRVMFVQGPISSDSNGLISIHGRHTSSMAQETFHQDGETTGDQFSCPLGHHSGHILDDLYVVNVKVDIVAIVKVVEDLDDLSVGALQGVTGEGRDI